MQVTETRADGLERELQVVVPASTLDQRLTDYLDDMRTKVKLKGFRPGKVPLNHLRRMYGKSAMAEIIEKVMSDAVRSAVEDRDEKPALQPDVAVDDSDIAGVMEGKSDLSFAIKYEVLPQITVEGLETISVERPVVAIADEEVDAEIQKIAEGNREFADVERPAEDGDRLTIDFVGKVDGVPFDGGSAEGVDITIGEGRFIPGFEEQLTGAAAGEARKVNVTFPEDYPAKHLAGQAAEFDVTVTAVAAPQDAAIDDALATRVGLDDLDALKGAVRTQMEQSYARVGRERVKRALLDALDERFKFELPQKLVESEFNTIWAEVQRDLERANKSVEDEGGEEKLRADYMGIAERRVRLGLLLSEVGTKANVEVTDEELQGALRERLRQFPGQEREVMQYYQKTPQAVAALRAPIFEEKVVDYILELVTVTEKPVSKDELAAEAAHDHDDHDHDHPHDHAHGHDHDHDH